MKSAPLPSFSYGTDTREAGTDGLDRPIDDKQSCVLVVLTYGSVAGAQRCFGTTTDMVN